MRRQLEKPWYQKEPKKAHASYVATRHAADNWTVALIKRRLEGMTLDEILEKMKSQGHDVTRAFAEKYMQRLVNKRLVKKAGEKFFV